MVTSLLCCKKFTKSFISYGFEFNPYHPYVANKMMEGSQMTICFHVDDCKLSHVNPKVMGGVVAWLKQNESIFEDRGGQMVVSCGKTHKYLRMTLDYTTTGQVKITMLKYIQEILTAFDEADPKAIGTKTSAASEDLFKINEDSPKLGSHLATAFYTLVAKTLYCTKCTCPNTCIATAFVTTRVREPDLHNWAKLTHLMKYLCGTRELPLILSANKNGIIKWYVDGSFGVHPNMKEHTSGGVTFGKVFPFVISTKHKLSTRSSST
jgi:hypothetical protein